MLESLESFEEQFTWDARSYDLWKPDFTVRDSIFTDVQVIGIS